VTTPAQLRQLILTTLTVADPAANDVLEPHIETLWLLCTPLAQSSLEIHYWLTRREAIKALMATYARQIDFRIGSAQGLTLSSTSLRQDGYHQMQQTDSMVRFRDAIGQDRYQDSSNGNSQLSDSRSRSSSTYNALSDSHKALGVGTSSRSHSKTGSTSLFGKGRRTISADGTGANSSSKSGRSDRWDGSSQSNGYVVLGGYNERTTNFSLDAYFSTYLHDWFSAGVTELNTTTDETGQRSDENGSTSRSAYDNATDSGTGSSTETMSGSGSKSASSSFLSIGDGTGQFQVKAQGQRISQETEKGHHDSEISRDSSAVKQAVLDASSLSQRFAHLQKLFDNATEMLAILRKRMRGSAAYTQWTEMIAIYPDGYTTAYGFTPPYGIMMPDGNPVGL